MAGTIGGTELQGIFLNDLGFDVNASVKTYETYAACSSDRVRLIDMYRNAGRNIVGGVCSRPTDPSAPRDWSVQLFEAN